MVDFLLKKWIKMLVIVCNIVMVVVLEEIKVVLLILVVGVILFGVWVVVKVIKNNKIGVIGILGIIKSVFYEIVIKSKVLVIEVISLVCFKFVFIVESN